MSQVYDVSKLQLGDVVKQFEGAFGTAVVTQIADGKVTLFRPYGVTADFSYTGGVIPYTGSETTDYSLDGGTTFLVYQRKEVR